MLEVSGDVDWEIIDLILGYTQRYADLCHHPIEDLIYQALEDKNIAMGEYARSLQDEHAELTLSTQQLRDSVNHHRMHPNGDFGDLISEAKAFLDSYWRHMESEETVLFKAALKALTAEDWQSLDSQMTKFTRSYSAQNSQERFLALRDYIHRLERINLADPETDSI
jgi:hemerythrin-like domain-containing protein